MPVWSIRPALLAGVAAGVSVTVSALVALTDPRVPLGDGHGRLAIDSAAATIGLLLAFLLYGRFRVSRRLGDAVATSAMLVIAGGNVLLSVVPSVVDGSGPLATGSVLAGSSAAFLVMASVWVPPRVVERPGRAVVAIVGTAGAVLLVAVAAARALPVRGLGSPDSFGGTPSVVVSGVQLVAASLFLLAAVGACTQAWRHDHLAGALAAASVFAAASRVNFATARAPDEPWIIAGSVLRMLFYLALLAAAAVEIRSYWRREAELAVLEERRRVARDLHDGMAQDLAFAAGQARVLAERCDDRRRAELTAAAAERALDESRRVIVALTRPLDEPLEVALARCAEEICGRFDADLRLDLLPGLALRPDAREALLRITREAVANAGRHGQARAVIVRLRGPRPVVLTVHDDGRGFDPDDLHRVSGRLGLVSMRERAEALGGSLAIRSTPAGGTRVEVRVP